MNVENYRGRLAADPNAFGETHRRMTVVSMVRRQSDRKGWLWRKNPQSETWTKVFGAIKGHQLSFFRDDKVSCRVKESQNSAIPGLMWRGKFPQTGSIVSTRTHFSLVPKTISLLAAAGLPTSSDIDIVFALAARKRRSCIEDLIDSRDVDVLTPTDAYTFRFTGCVVLTATNQSRRVFSIACFLLVADPLQAAQPSEVFSLSGSTVKDLGSEAGKPPGRSSRVLGIQVKTVVGFEATRTFSDN